MRCPSPASEVISNHTDRRTQWLWFAGALALGLWFVTLGTRLLLNPDEGRYAEIAREMLASGDWVTPRLNGIKYFEKPPLQYWMTALAYQAFGVNEFAARFWTGLTGVAGVLLAGFAGMRLFSRSAGVMAAAITASSLLYVTIGHVNNLDMGLSFFLQLAICSFLIAQRSAPASASERNWMLLAWTGAALGFLSKGLVALVLPALTLLAYTAITREYSAWKRLHILKGLGLFLVLTLPWLVASARANPEFLRFFFMHEQFERFLTDSHDRDGPWWYFLPLFILGSLPWTFVALGQFMPAWRLDGQGYGLQPRRFLMLWVVVVVGFFSLSHSKLPPYIVPVIPMFGMLLGDLFTRLPIHTLRRHLLITGSALGLLGAAVSFLPDNIAGAKAIDVVVDLRPETAIGFLLISATLLCSCSLWRRKTLETTVVLAALGTLLGLSVLLQGANALSKTRSGYALSQHIAPLLRPDTRLFSVGDYDQTLPFYLHRRMTLVNYRGELDFGLTREPELGIDTIEAFARTWQNQRDAIAVMPPALYTELLNRGLPMQLVTQQAKLVAVRKPQVGS